MIDDLVVSKMGSLRNINHKLRSEIEGAVKTAQENTEVKFAGLRARLVRHVRSASASQTRRSKETL